MKLSWLRKARSIAATAAAATFIFAMSGCGGGGGTYEAPNSTPTATTPSWWSSYDVSESAVVSASKVAGWIQNGYKTAAGDPVVILDVQTDFTDAAANRIIGSTAAADIEAFTIFDYRAEGPIDTTIAMDTSSKMVPKGTTMDAILQDLGATKDTVIVLTSAQSGNGVWNLTRGWWMFYYWGLSEANIKVLDGGVAAVAAGYPTLVNTTAESVDPADSVFSVMDLPGLHSSARVSTKQVIDAVKAGSAKIVDARATSGTSGVAFGGRIKNAIVAPTALIGGANLVNADGTFLTKAEAQAAFDAAGISSTDRIIVHCFSGYSATPIYFFIKEVMEYENVALYDGSWSAWSVHTAYSPVTATYTDGVTTIAWDGVQFKEEVAGTTITSADIDLGGTLQADDNASLIAFDTLKYSTNVLLKAVSAFEDIYGDSKFVLNASYTGTGSELSAEDAAYIASDDVTTTDTEDSTDVVAPVDNSGC